MSKDAGQPRARVLMIVENLPVPFDRRVWQEALALRRGGYAVAVICPKGKGHDRPHEQLDGIDIYRHALVERSGAIGYLIEYSMALLWQMRLSIKIRRRHGFDVIHACNPPDTIFLIAGFWKIFCGVRFIFDHHDLSPELYKIKFDRADWLYRLLLRLERFTFRTADASIATNETFKEIAVSRGGMRADRVWVVKSYPDFTRFRRVPPNEALRGGFAYLVGYVGILAEQDGVHLLVEAMADIVIRQDRRDIGCVIIGDGPELARLKALATDLGVADYVTFTGYRGGEELLAALAACDIGVIPDPPNGCNEKLSMNKVFEYMALGLPIVQFDLAQARRESRHAARVVNEPVPAALAAGIAALLADPEARRVMSDYGRATAAAEFVWEAEARSLLEAYDTVLGKDLPAQAHAGGRAD